MTRSGRLAVGAVLTLAVSGLTGSRWQGPQGDASQALSITYVANEGVLLSAAGRHVLIDGLFRYYRDGFPLPHDSTREALERATTPFDGVDVVLVTHRHGDHFHPAAVASHLLANPRATLLTSRQVIDSLRGSLPPNHDLERRMLARTLVPFRVSREEVAGIGITMLGLPHGGPQRAIVEHLGFVVELGGRRILHVGDADISEDTFRPFRLDTARIDVAMVPVWMATSAEGRRVIDRWIKPRQVIVFHMPAGDLEGAAVRQALPTAIVFTQSLDRRSF